MLEILQFIRKYLHLCTIRDTDKVVFINNSKIVEQGNHQQLLDAKGFYDNIYISQFKGGDLVTRQLSQPVSGSLLNAASG